MSNGEPNTPVPEGDKTNPPVENSDKPLTPQQEARKIVEDQKNENDRREKLIEEEKQLRAEGILAGDTGGRVGSTPPKKDTDEEYANKFKKGEVNPLKEDGIEL